eukprot:gene2269-2581_t
MARCCLRESSKIFGGKPAVEVYKYAEKFDPVAAKAAPEQPAVVRACITKLPPGYSRIEVAQMEDAIWGLDGFDT